jgi:hypothetical protein
MNRNQIILAFDALGKLMRLLGDDQTWPGFSSGLTEKEYVQLQNIINRQVQFNGWFTPQNVRNSLRTLGSQLYREKLEEWTLRYEFSQSPKKVALIMAGNLPLVGFHDFLGVLLSGHSVIAKLSSEDKFLLPNLVDYLLKFEPALKDRIQITEGKIVGMEAVIATGSDNSSLYFEQYFGKYPHIFRRNRTSVAVLDGSETMEELGMLGHDIFDYFGLGCRNVSHLIISAEFDLNRLFEAIFPFSEIAKHHKYANNYDYHKAIYLLNNVDLLDNNFVLLRETDELFSPLGMIYYHRYKKAEEIQYYLDAHKEKIQVIVGRDYLPFGKAQSPQLDEYADGVDTMLFLEQL